MHGTRNWSFVLLTLLLTTPLALTAPPVGYYRQPALGKDTIVVVSEGDLWKVRDIGGVATRLTSHHGEEAMPAVSPDGQTLAFTAQYEGPTEVYTMPLSGGRPQRRTYGAGPVSFVGWTPNGQILYATESYSSLPNTQLVTIDLNSGISTVLPLAQAAQGTYNDTGETLYFTRLPFQGSYTTRYKGGTAQTLWKFCAGDTEAKRFVTDHAGTSRRPLWWQGRIFFVTDRDGTMNIWSVKADGSDLKQHTRHTGWDVTLPSLWGGRMVYQLGADIHLYDIAADQDRVVPITLDSDLDQTRERWIENPMDYLTAAHLAPDGGRVALTARGRVFVVPNGPGRLVEAARKEGVRYRDARFFPDGKSLLMLSDESGEYEFWRQPANGLGTAERLTTDAEVFRWEGLPSPNGQWIAHRDKNQRLFLYDVRKKTNRLIEESKIGDFSDLAWATDSRWLAYVAPAANLLTQIKLFSLADSKITPLTSDRFDSYSPAWSSDGRWLYFLSDRHLQSVVESPEGSYQPEPYLDKKTKIYQIALTDGLRSPFAQPDELHPEEEVTVAEDEPEKPAARAKADKVRVKIDRAGIEKRLLEAPIPPGNYRDLVVKDFALFWLSAKPGEKKEALVGAPIRSDPDVTTIAEEIRRFELSQDGRKILIEKDNKLYVVDAMPGKADLSHELDLSKWKFSVQPREEWRQMFREAWRLERDYFYDPNMHGVDWKGALQKYLPLVERVHSRTELADLMAQMVSELSVLHLYVQGGDVRRGKEQIEPASLGADLVRDAGDGGYRIVHLYQADPDEPELAGPLARHHVKEGDVIEMVNNQPALAVADLGVLLRGKAGQQVLLRIKPAAGGKSRDLIVTPFDMDAAAELRYHEWEFTRRQKVEELGGGAIGYVHLRAMDSDTFTEWAKGYYPVFNRKGLIIDVRNNEGGNIDSWILSRLLRKAWSFESQRIGQSPSWNMPFAFRGHLVVLCNENTASDGEIFAEGVKRLGLGKVIGTRTWGGGIGLTFSNFLVDKGIATAAEFGTYGPEGLWLIEGHGVEPDQVVDNLPHAAFKGEDAQLQAAVAHLKQLIREKPIQVPQVPVYPKKAVKVRPGGRKTLKR
jgi:tricorn protease